MMTSRKSFTLALALVSALSLAACTKKNTTAGLGTDGLGGPGMGLAGGSSQVAGSPDDFKVNVGDRIFFHMDQTDLTGESQDTLMKQAAWLKQYPDVTVQIEGHADERGTREYNISLSARRAVATRNFLIAQGISSARISTIAYGKERPAALCDAEECWSQNRRAVTVITGGARTS